jgi:hypothetical protein
MGRCNPNKTPWAREVANALREHTSPGRGYVLAVIPRMPLSSPISIELTFTG